MLITLTVLNGSQKSNSNMNNSDLVNKSNAAFMNPCRLCTAKLSNSKWTAVVSLINVSSNAYFCAEARLIGQSFPGSFLVPFLKRGNYFHTL